MTLSKLLTLINRLSELEYNSRNTGFLELKSVSPAAPKSEILTGAYEEKRENKEATPCKVDDDHSLNIVEDEVLFKSPIMTKKEIEELFQSQDNSSINQAISGSIGPTVFHSPHTKSELSYLAVSLYYKDKDIDMANRKL